MESRYMFRGKRLDNRGWHYGDMMRDDDRVYIGTARNYDYQINPATLGQCTGLSAAKSYRGDKPEDLLIWEGDICWDIGWEKAFVVFWSREQLAWMFKFLDSDETDFLEEVSFGSTVGYARTVETIGTIHDRRNCNGSPDENL